MPDDSPHAELAVIVIGLEDVAVYGDVLDVTEHSISKQQQILYSFVFTLLFVYQIFIHSLSKSYYEHEKTCIFKLHQPWRSPIRPTMSKCA